MGFYLEVQRSKTQSVIPNWGGDLIVLTTAAESKNIQVVVAFNHKIGKEEWLTRVSHGRFPMTDSKNSRLTHDRLS